MEINTQATLERLKEGKSHKVKQTLDKLNSILQKYEAEGGKDFSISEIGKRVSPLDGGPGYETIRATRNKHYRDLIEVWAAKAGTNTKKPKSALSTAKMNIDDYDLLERLEDPALRGIFGSIITERNKLKNENNLLKKDIEVVIDRRPVAKNTSADNTIVKTISSTINELEYEALKYSISNDCMEEHGWEIVEHGRVIDKEYNKDVFPRGFVNAIQKILNSYDNEK